MECITDGAQHTKLFSVPCGTVGTLCKQQRRINVLATAQSRPHRCCFGALIVNRTKFQEQAALNLILSGRNVFSSFSMWLSRAVKYDCDTPIDSVVSFFKSRTIIIRLSIRTVISAAPLRIVLYKVSRADGFQVADFTLKRIVSANASVWRYFGIR